MTDHNHHKQPDSVSRRARAQIAALFYERMMLVLLALLVLMLFVVPVLADTVIEGRLLVDLMLTAVLIVGTLAVSANRTLMWILAACSAVALALRWSEWILPLGLLAPVRDASVLLSLLVMSVAVGINVFGPDSNVMNRLIGAIVLYLLVAMMWASAYLIVSFADPSAFSKPTQPETPTLQWLYFSFTTLTTLGYGDIVPVSRLARSLAMVEALIGQLYPAVILARLVSVDLSNRP